MFHYLYYSIKLKFKNLFSKLNQNINNLERFVAYRTYDKYHIVNTGLPPDYYDKDTLILHANFAILKDFVESELAYMQAVFGESDKLTKLQKFRLSRYLPRFIARIFLPKINSRDLGTDYLFSYIESHSIPYDKSRHQGCFGNKRSYDKFHEKYRHFYLEVLDLYIWWVDVRPKRKDEYEDVGLEKFLKEM